MSRQTTLTADGTITLDATCSYNRIWPRYATIRIDIRPEVKPDIVMDNTDLKFPAWYFDHIYYDPPHLIRSSPIHPSLGQWRRMTGRGGSLGMFDLYGWWKTKAEWLHNLEGVNREFYRCLKPTGLLHAKIGEARKNHTVHIEDVLEQLTNFGLVADRTTKTRSKMPSGCVVHWMTLKPLVPGARS